MWFLLPLTAVAVRNVSFANYGDGYLEVIAEGVSCAKTSQYKLQRSKESAAVLGTVRPGIHTDEYGLLENSSQAVHDSGMFVPEFNTGDGVETLLKDNWKTWTTSGTNTDAIASYKYAPTGMVYTRNTGSIEANKALARFLNKLKNNFDTSKYNYSLFQEHTKEPWNFRENHHQAFPGMLPAQHPVLDSGTKSRVKQYAVRPCPNDETKKKCCLVVENGQKGEEIDFMPSNSMLKTKLDKQFEGEKTLRWHQLGFHTSFSRGLPDLYTLTRDRVTTDVTKLFGEGGNFMLPSLKTSLTNAKSNYGDAKDLSNGENEQKCRRVNNGWASFWTATRLEHFYTAVVGVEEEGMLRQKTPEYDGDPQGDDSKLKQGQEGEPPRNEFNFVDDHSCEHQPGGHCGFGYYCNYNFAQEHNEYGGNPTENVRTRDYCISKRWRGRPELLRFYGDGVSPETSSTNYSTLAHVLDGERSDWYNEPYRMSARLVYTGPDTEKWEERAMFELPCSTTRMDGLYKNVAGDFSRACTKMRATKYEWLVSAMLATHFHGDDDLHHSNADDDGFAWETDRGIGPMPCSLNSNTCFMNNRNNRVRLWDLDSTWSVNTKKNNYQGAEEDLEYFKRLKALRKRPTDHGTVEHEFAQWPDENDLTALRMTSHGSSDGTSRTNIHSHSCFLPDFMAEAGSGDNDRASKFNADTDGTYYAARPTFWPYTWGTMRAINADVAASFPAGCDFAYGPPCEFGDAVKDVFWDSGRKDWDYNGMYHKQGGPGVFGCSYVRERGGFEQKANRSDWDTYVFGPAFVYAHRRNFPTGSHTCASLSNATHFKLDDLDSEEWDMRTHFVHTYGNYNCAYDDGVSIRCSIAAISLNCHNGVNPTDNKHNTYVYKDGETIKAKFVATDIRSEAQNEVSRWSPNFDYANENAIWVNWGKHRKNTDGDSGSYNGDSLSDKFSPYKDGKDDGILECQRPRDDLLLHSLHKRTKVCSFAPNTNDRKKLAQYSPCVNTKEYHRWRQNLDLENLDDPDLDKFFLADDKKLSTGRSFPAGGHEINDQTEFQCDCEPTAQDSKACHCNLMERTTRLVVGKNRGDERFFESKPYSPDWVRYDASQDDDPLWCMPPSINKDEIIKNDRGYVPRRVCKKDYLMQTQFWSGQPFESDQIPSALEKGNADVFYVQRQNSVYSNAELMELRACVNIEGGEFCNNDVLEVASAPGFAKTNAGSNILSVIIDLPAPYRSCEVYFKELTRSDTSNILNGKVTFEDAGLTDSNIITTADRGLCHVKRDLPTDPNTDAGGNPFESWNLGISESFTLNTDYIKNSMGIYELRKLKQCMEASQSCPVIVFRKTLELTIPLAQCPRTAIPKIMYRCYEDNDPNTLPIEGVAEMTEIFLLNTESMINTYQVRGFQHTVKQICLDKIQFAIECNGHQELNELDNDVCKAYGFSEYCEPTVNFKVLQTAMCRKPYEFPKTNNGVDFGIPQFYIDQPKNLKLKDLKPGDTDFTGQGCECRANKDKIARIIVEKKGAPFDGNGDCVEQQALAQYGTTMFTVEDGNTSFNTSICTPIFREVDLRDYRKDMNMHVYWKHCNALRLYFEYGTTSADKYYGNRAFIAVSPEINPSSTANRFLARLSIPLDDDLVSKHPEGGTVMWGVEDQSSVIRELVPEFCAADKTTVLDNGRKSARFFTRRVPFDFDPGEPFAKIKLGRCTDQTKSAFNFCNTLVTGVSRSTAFFPHMQPHGFVGGLSIPLKTTRASAKECWAECKYTEGCKTFAYTGSAPGEGRCILFDEVPTLVRLLKDNAEDVFNPQNYNDLGGDAGMGTCFESESIPVEVLRPPVPPPPLCQSGYTLVPVSFVQGGEPNTFQCVRTACDPNKEVAVPIATTAVCGERCQSLCKNTHDTLSTYTTHQPARWTVEDSDKYEYADHLPLKLSPRFEFLLPEAGRTLQGQNLREIEEVSIMLPPVQLEKCNPCGNNGETDALCHNKHKDSSDHTLLATMADFEITISDHQGNILQQNQVRQEIVPANGPTHGPNRVTVTLRSDDLDDLTVETFPFIIIAVNTTVVQGGTYSGHSLEYNINGYGCKCTDFNSQRKPLSLSNVSELNQEFDSMSCFEEEPTDFPKTGRLPSATISVCNAPAEPPEICLPRTACDERAEYVVDDGSLERDRKCERLTTCLNSEYESVSMTATSDRECKTLVECGEFEKEDKPGTPTNQFECSSLSRCGPEDEFMDTTSKLCAKRTVCKEKGLRQVKDAAAFADAVCTSYEVICNDAQFTTSEPTLTTEAECKSYTVCEAQEFTLRSATVSTDRECTPLQTCKEREIYRGPDNFEEDAVCTPIVRFRWAWVTAAILAAGYLATVFQNYVENGASNLVHKRR